MFATRSAISEPGVLVDPSQCGYTAGRTKTQNPPKDLIASDVLKRKEKAAYRVLRKWGMCQWCKDSDFQHFSRQLRICPMDIKSLQRGLSWQSAAQ